MKAHGGPTLAPLPSHFYLDPPDTVAQKLLGKLLIRKIGGKTLIGRIVETEAYLGRDDPAAHSFAGKTTRNSMIFGPPGRAYVYFIYGMYYCLNVTCEPEGQAGCVLLRALEPIAGLGEMAALRGLPHDTDPRLLTSGPGRLCQALAVTRLAHNGLNLTDPKSELWIADDGFLSAAIAITPRIGIRKATERPLRFLIEENRFVSASPTRRLASTNMKSTRGREQP